MSCCMPRPVANGRDRQVSAGADARWRHGDGQWPVLRGVDQLGRACGARLSRTVADRKHPGPSPRIVPGSIFTIIVVLAVVVGSAPATRFEATDTLADGMYSGGIYLKVDLAFIELSAGGSGTLENRADAVVTPRLWLRRNRFLAGGRWRDQERTEAPGSSMACPSRSLVAPP